MAPVVKNPPASAGDARDVGFIHGLGRSPWGGNGNPHQCSCLKIFIDKRGMTQHTHTHTGLISKPWTWLLETSKWPSFLWVLQVEIQKLTSGPGKLRVTDNCACVCINSIVLHFQSCCTSDNSKTDEVHLLQVQRPLGIIRNRPGRGQDSRAVKKSDVFSSCLTLKFKLWGKSLQK